MVKSFCRLGRRRVIHIENLGPQNGLIHHEGAEDYYSSKFNLTDGREAWVISRLPVHLTAGGMLIVRQWTKKGVDELVVARGWSSGSHDKFVGRIFSLEDKTD